MYTITISCDWDVCREKFNATSRVNDRWTEALKKAGWGRLQINDNDLGPEFLRSDASIRLLCPYHFAKIGGKD